MQCPHCSKDIAISREFCPFCGQKIEMAFGEIASSVDVDAANRRGQTIEASLRALVFLLAFIATGIYCANNLLDRNVTFNPGDLPAATAPVAHANSNEGMALNPYQEIQKLRAHPPGYPVAFAYRFEPLKSRLLTENRAPANLQDGIKSGLSYLRNQQSADGSWIPTGKNLNIRAPNDQSQSYQYMRVGLTGLALLPFLGNGELWLKPEDLYAECIKRGLAYLIQQQDPGTGRYGGTEGFFMLNHGMATLAVAEAAGMSGDPWLRESAQRAVVMIERAQGPGGGWGLTDATKDDEDTICSVWQISALLAAREAGLELNPETLKKAHAFLVSVTNSDGTVKYTPKDNFTPPRHILTSMCLMARLQLDQEPRNSAAYRPMVNKIMDTTNLPFAEPNWGKYWTEQQDEKQVNHAKRATTFDSYRWYFSTYALFMRSGDPQNLTAQQEWENWNAALIKFQLMLQDIDGAWRGNDIWSVKYGAAFTTALCLLSLQAYYRLQ